MSHGHSFCFDKQHGNISDKYPLLKNFLESVPVPELSKKLCLSTLK